MIYSACKLATHIAFISQTSIFELGGMGLVLRVASGRDLACSEPPSLCQNIAHSWKISGEELPERSELFGLS